MRASGGLMRSLGNALRPSSSNPIGNVEQAHDRQTTAIPRTRTFAFHLLHRIWTAVRFPIGASALWIATHIASMVMEMGSDVKVDEAQCRSGTTDIFNS